MSLKDKARSQFGAYTLAALLSTSGVAAADDLDIDRIAYKNTIDYSVYDDREVIVERPDAPQKNAEVIRTDKWGNGGDITIENYERRRLVFGDEMPSVQILVVDGEHEGINHELLKFVHQRAVLASRSFPEEHATVDAVLGVKAGDLTPREGEVMDYGILLYINDHPVVPFMLEAGQEKQEPQDIIPHLNKNLENLEKWLLVTFSTGHHLMNEEQMLANMEEHPEKFGEYEMNFDILDELGIDRPVTTSRAGGTGDDGSSSDSGDQGSAQEEAHETVSLNM